MIVDNTPSDRDLLQRFQVTGQMRIHFSQFGEDALLWTYLQKRQTGFYVDVG